MNATVTPIASNLHVAPAPALVEEIARYSADAAAELHEPCPEPPPGAELYTPAALAAEYRNLVRAAAGLHSVEVGTIEVIHPDGEKRVTAAEIEPGDCARALVTTALRSLALRRAALQAAHDFAAVLWIARRHASQGKAAASFGSACHTATGARFGHISQVPCIALDALVPDDDSQAERLSAAVEAEKNRRGGAYREHAMTRVPTIGCDHSDGIDPDSEPCIDCGILLPLGAEAYAVDSAVVCPLCARKRYGDKAAEYLIA